MGCGSSKHKKEKYEEPPRLTDEQEQAMKRKAADQVMFNAGASGESFPLDCTGFFRRA
jgi:hypothetical protein